MSIESAKQALNEGLSPEEKEVDRLLDWSDESLGRLARTGAEVLKDKEGRDGTMIASSALVIMTKAHLCNANEIKFTCEGVTHTGQPCGDWELICHRISAPPEKETPK